MDSRRRRRARGMRGGVMIKSQRAWMAVGVLGLFFTALTILAILAGATGAKHPDQSPSIVPTPTSIEGVR